MTLVTESSDSFTNSDDLSHRVVTRESSSHYSVTRESRLSYSRVMTKLFTSHYRIIESPDSCEISSHRVAHDSSEV